MSSVLTRAPKNRQTKKPQDDKIYGVYISSALTMKVVLTINQIGKRIKQNIENTIAKNIEGRCIKEGFIQPE